MPDFGGRNIPRLYPILDAEMVLRDGSDNRGNRETLLRRIAAELADAGVQILQYRNKRDDDETVAEDARVIREAATGITLILNDRAALAATLGWDGVHIGQQDMPASEARHRVGPSAWVGLSTHNEEQTRAAALEPVDYIAIGPVFATSSKANPDPVIDLEGVRRARGLTRKPLVAIGGITADTAAAVIDAGADAVAVIGAVFASGHSVSHSVRDFLAKFK
ncbi:MAG TPA: thiamine phosphate synthase [Acidobacteriaceae bacterium]|nr:thiamine phosphate synthase [Acidobacteriaceae bacterium]